MACRNITLSEGPGSLDAKKGVVRFYSYLYEKHNLDLGRDLLYEERDAFKFKAAKYEEDFNNGKELSPEERIRLRERQREEETLYLFAEAELKRLAELE